MARIHALAAVDPAAEIGDDVEIGPFCSVGPHVVLAAGCRLISHVVVAGHTRIGAGTVVHPFASLGSAPQSTGYRGGPTRLEIGAGCDIREGVTMSLGTEDGGEVTSVGERGFFMAYAHVGHDCHVGNEVTFANCATLGGHCEIGDNVFIGGLSAVHQFTRVGRMAMIGGVAGVRADVIPFGLATGDVARLAGTNSVGLRRRGFGGAVGGAVRKAYRMLFLEPGSLEQRMAATEDALGHEPLVQEILAFIRSRGKRPLCRPSRGEPE